jgi:ATP-dependent Clp protease ATP-binding subunit ClpC
MSTGSTSRRTAPWAAVPAHHRPGAVGGEAVEIIRAPEYEAHHRVKITDAAIDLAVKLADRHITEHHLPDKAIDVIDEAASRTRLQAMTPPATIKELEKEIERVVREKDMFLEAQEFEKAASLREKEKALRGREEELKREWEKNKNRQTQVVGEQDIEYIVSRWTGIRSRGSRRRNRRSSPGWKRPSRAGRRQDDAIRAVSARSDARGPA